MSATHRIVPWRASIVSSKTIKEHKEQRQMEPTTVYQRVWKVDLLLSTLFVAISTILVNDMVTSKIVLMLFVMLLLLIFYRLYNHTMKMIEEKRNEKRKEPIHQELEGDLSKGRAEIQNFLHLLSIGIEKLQNGIQTHGAKKLLKEYLTFRSVGQDKLSEVEQLFSRTKALINCSESTEWIHLIKFRQQLQQSIQQCRTNQEKIKELKFIYKLTSDSILAENTRQIAVGLEMKLPNSKNNLKLYKLPVEICAEQKQIRRFQYGEDTGKQHKYMMMVGMTGAGKSLLINNMINYIYGVQHSDDFRFKLIVESEEIQERSGTNSESQAFSMTSHVSAFTLHWQEGFRIPYSLTIIDTPGFGDTRGIDYDEEIVRQIKHFFTDEKIFKSSEITCIGLVTQASQARITVEQKYIVDSVLQLFAKDIADNIFMFFTFADGQPPPAIQVLKEQDIPHAKGKYYKFNNSALYAENDSDFFWKFGYDSLQKLFADLVETDSKSLNLTKKNLEEREMLRNTLEQLKPQINAGINKLDTIQQETELLKKIKTDIEISRNHKTTIKVEVEEPEDVSHSITNCLHCHNTCHDPCGIEGDMKMGCSSIDQTSGKCTVCPQNCFYDQHRNGTCRYNRVWVAKEVTAEDIMKKYHISLKDKNAKKLILIKLVEDYQTHKAQVFALINKAKECSNRLEEIALRPSMISNVQYIERLIEAEEKKNKNRKGAGQRLKQLRNMRDLAQLFHDCSTKSLDIKITEQEEELHRIMLDALDGDDDDKDYIEAKEEAKKGFITKLKMNFGLLWGALGLEHDHNPE